MFPIMLGFKQINRWYFILWNITFQDGAGRGKNVFIAIWETVLVLTMHPTRLKGCLPAVIKAHPQELWLWEAPGWSMHRHKVEQDQVPGVCGQQEEENGLAAALGSFGSFPSPPAKKCRDSGPAPRSSGSKELIRGAPQHPTRSLCCTEYIYIGRYNSKT